MRGSEQARRKPPLTAALVALAALACTPGCRHRGPGWTPDPARATSTQERAEAPSEVALELIVLGSVRPGDSPRARRLGARLETLLDGDELVLWLGTDLGRAGPDARVRDCSSEGDSPVLALVEAQARSVWRLPGPDEWRCSIEPEAPSSWVVRVGADGTARADWSCGADGCALDLPPARHDDRLEIVGLELATWAYPELLDDARRSALHQRQAELLDALPSPARDPERPGGPPRLLVAAVPVDSAGAHGHGGRLERAGMHRLPKAVRDAVQAGQFAGVLAGLEPSLQLSEDLGPAMIRSARSFPKAPVFQVISGAAGGGRPALPTSRGRALIPELESEHLGFARLLVDPTSSWAEVELHAHVGGRWQVARAQVSLEPPAHGAVRPAVPIQPCLRCDPVKGAADGPVYVPR